jgi:predicted RNA-binding Zn-ribbon protein involved in translation (DUF1610 family)
VTDLERLFNQIMLNLVATDPARARRPLPLAEIRDSIVPYRANRRALQLESSEDYELALMRLCAGEGGLAFTEPEEAQEAFAAELKSPNPDLTIVQRHEKALVNFYPDAVARVTNSSPDLAFAPKQEVVEAASGEPKSKAAHPEPAKPLSRCSRCASELPPGRVVNFCPQCGQHLTRRYCPQCNAELQTEWRHCISCGTAISPSQNRGGA